MIFNVLLRDLLLIDIVYYFRYIRINTKRYKYVLSMVVTKVYLQTTEPCGSIPVSERFTLTSRFLLVKIHNNHFFFCFWNNSNCITSHFGPFLSVAYEFVFISLPAFEHWISMLKEFDEYFLKYFDKYFLRIFFSASIFDCT